MKFFKSHPNSPLFLCITNISESNDPVFNVKNTFLKFYDLFDLKKKH